MMNNKPIILILCACMLVCTLSCSNADCKSMTLASGEIAVLIRTISVDEILDNEIKRGLLALRDKAVRREFLTNQIHLSIRIVKDGSFTSEQKQYLTSAIKDDITLSDADKILTKSLFINESMMPGENIAQFFLAFHDAYPINDQLTLLLNSEELDLVNQSVSIPTKCCS